MLNVLTSLLPYLLASPLVVESLVSRWSVVPPSTNPSSSLNQNLLQELGCLDGVTCHKVDTGRVWLEAIDPTVLKKLDARSVRLVVLQASDLTETASTVTIVEALTNGDWKKELSNAIKKWVEMGNIPPSPGENFTFCMKCQRWNDFVNPHQSTSSVANDMSTTLTGAFGWKRVKKNQEPSLIFHVLLYASVAVVELVTLIRPIPIEELPKPGFKRVESFVLARAANIQRNQVVLDPMCGRATFLIEAATFWPDATYIGVDASEQQLHDARINCQSAKVKVQLLSGDATHLSQISDSSVDRIICCPPFGRQFKKKSMSLYSDLLIEWSRVLADDGTMVLLIDSDNTPELIEAIVQSGCQIIFQRSPFRLGRLRATILVANKSCMAATHLHTETGTFHWEGGDLKGRTLWSFLRSQALPKLSPVRPSEVTR